MIRGTTPTVTFNIHNISDMAEILDAWVSFATQDVLITKHKSDLTISNTDKTIKVSLTQDDTLQLKGKTVETQIKIKSYDGVVCASEVVEIPLEKILDKTKM